MIKVLFICHGNICRSTMAQYVFQHMVDENGLTEMFYIDSAATSTEEIGNGIHYGTSAKLDQEGIPYGDHRARQIVKSDYNEYDYLIGMDSANICNIERMIGPDTEGKVFKLLEFADIYRDIADPWYTGNFEETYNDVKIGCESLLDYIMK